MTNGKAFLLPASEMTKIAEYKRKEDNRAFCESDFFAEIVKKIETEAREGKLEMEMSITNEEEKRYASSAVEVLRMASYHAEIRRPAYQITPVLSVSWVK